MIKKQTVYIPTKVDDDFPRKEVCGISDDNETMLVGYIRNTEFSKTGYEISDDEQNLTSITHWLKPTEGYFFTLEELKQLLEEYTNRIVENHYLNIDGIGEKSNGQKYIVDEGNHYCETEITVDKDSITNQLPLMLKELGYE